MLTLFPTESNKSTVPDVDDGICVETEESVVDSSTTLSLSQAVRQATRQIARLKAHKKDFFRPKGDCPWQADAAA